MNQVSPHDLIAKAERALESARLLQNAGDVNWLVQQAADFVQTMKALLGD